MLRRGIRVVSITEHADDSPTGKLMEAIIESVDEFYSENLAQEVTCGMREAASRGFWVGTYAPYGYRKVYVQDGAKKRPKLEPDPPADAVIKRIFDMALTASEAKSEKYTYYVYHSLLKKRKGTCEPPGSIPSGSRASSSPTYVRTSSPSPTSETS